MNKEHIQELRSAFDRALAELAAIAEGGAMPYEVRCAAMQAHISIAAKARETIAHLYAAIAPSGVSGTTAKGADLVAALDRQAKHTGNATAMDIVREFKSGPDEHMLATPGERLDKEHVDAMPFRGLAKGESVEGVEAVGSTSVKATPQHTETFTNAAMPYVPPALVTSNWGKSRKSLNVRDWFDVNE